MHHCQYNFVTNIIAKESIEINVYNLVLILFKQRDIPES